MNISAKTNILNIEKTQCSPAHLQHCFSDKNLHGPFSYTYFGPRVQKGTVDLFTKNGVFRVKFDVAYGWFRKIEIL